MHTRGGDRTKHEEQGPLEPAADPAQLDRRRGEHDHGRLERDVAMLDVGELVGKHAFQLGGRAG